jgi:hypothetical protein
MYCGVVQVRDRITQSKVSAVKVIHYIKKWYINNSLLQYINKESIFLGANRIALHRFIILVTTIHI